MAKMNPQGARARGRARRLVLQGLYQWQLSGAPAREISAELTASQNTKDTDTDYFEELLKGIVGASAELEAV